MHSHEVLVCQTTEGKTVFEAQLRGMNLQCAEGDMRQSLRFSMEAFEKMLGIPADVHVTGVSYEPDRRIVSFFLEEKR